MSTEAYEIELVRSETEWDYHIAMLATITGLPRMEIYERLPEKLKKSESWRGSSFVEVARLLGFNTNPRFIKFDPATPWPCILRIQVPEEWGWKGKWWALVYNQGKVYCVGNSEDHPAWRSSLEYFKLEYSKCRITSMLQIWISDL